MHLRTLLLISIFCWNSVLRAEEFLITTFIHPKPASEEDRARALKRISVRAKLVQEEFNRLLPTLHRLERTVEEDVVRGDKEKAVISRRELNILRDKVVLLGEVDEYLAEYSQFLRTSPLAKDKEAAGEEDSTEHWVDPVELYFVASGDTYEHIAKLKEVDLKQLRRLNYAINLKEGQILWIPPARKEPGGKVPTPDTPLPQRP